MEDLENFFGKEISDLAELVSKESGIPKKDLLVDLKLGAQFEKSMQKSENGKYKVIGVDRFDNEDWLHAEYDTPEGAVKEARKKTKEAMSSASDESIATIFYAYDPAGNYIGGNTWDDLKAQKNPSEVL